MPRARLVPLCVAMLAVLGLGSSPAQATKFWKNSVVTGDWGTDNNWSINSADGVDFGGVPVGGEAVNIVFTDGTARTVTYDVSAPSLGLLSIDLTGPGAASSTLSLPNDNSLSANGIYVGGYSGVGVTSGRGTLDQSAGTVTTNPGRDLVVGHGASSSGDYTLSGGALVANQSEFIGFSGTGTFNHTGGTNTINASAVGAFDLGGFVGATGTYNLGGTGALTVNAHEYIGDSGTGFFNHTAGTNTIVGAGHNLYLGFGASGVGTYTISGTATLDSAGNVIVGNNGTGTLNIEDQASVSIANNLSINNLSTVNLDGGTLRFNTISGLNRLNYSSGTIRLAGNRNLGTDATIAYLFGPLLAPPASITIPSGKSLHVEGTAELDRPTTTVTVSGGSLTSANLFLGGFLGDEGALVITNGGTVTTTADASLGGDFATSGVITVSGASTWSVGTDVYLGVDPGHGALVIREQSQVYIGRGLYIGAGDSVSLSYGTIRFDGYSRSPSGVFYFDAGTIQLAGNRTIGSDAAILDLFGASPTIPTGKGLVVEGTATLTASAPVTLSGGTLSAQTVLMSPGSRLSNTLPAQVSGAMLALAGSVIDATGANLTVGDATKVNGFYGNGTLQVGQSTVTLADANDAVLDSAALATLGAGGSPGTLDAANGLTLDFGGNIAGFGAVSTPNDPARPLINNGHITGDSVGEPIALPGYVKGVGTFDNVNFTGTFAPGLSPTILFVGNIALSPTSTLVMEFGGTTPGSGYDQIQSSGELTLDGTLEISLINGFMPTAGQTFEIFNGASLVGAFSSLILPTVPGLTWDTSQLLMGMLSAGLPGDYNQNGTVDAADFVVWRNTLGQAGAGLAADGNGSGTIDPGDYDVWRAHFGQTVGSGAGAGVPLAAASAFAIPEPASLFLLGLAMSALALAVRRRSER